MSISKKIRDINIRTEFNYAQNRYETKVQRDGYSANIVAITFNKSNANASQKEWINNTKKHKKDFMRFVLESIPTIKVGV